MRKVWGRTWSFICLFPCSWLWINKQFPHPAPAGRKKIRAAGYGKWMFQYHLRATPDSKANCAGKDCSNSKECLSNPALVTATRHSHPHTEMFTFNPWKTGSDGKGRLLLSNIYLCPWLYRVGILQSARRQGFVEARIHTYMAPLMGSQLTVNENIQTRVSLLDLRIRFRYSAY